MNWELNLKMLCIFLSKVVTVSSEFEHAAAAAAENTVKLKDEKRLKLTSDSKFFVFCFFLGGGGLKKLFRSHSL